MGAHLTLERPIGTKQRPANETIIPDPIRAELGLYGPIRAELGLYGPIRAELGLYGPIRAELGLYGPIRAFVLTLRTRDLLEPSGTFWNFRNRLEPSGTFWNLLEPPAAEQSQS
ncbi:hypothetical protein WMY93_033292 [Mugilogobius chulae]|uniref:Uncharacterized protein n=1 Tax=Mugilogobius chulae TaxID=88201 RepID=A0AAW0MHK8_9GOBI